MSKTVIDPERKIKVFREADVRESIAAARSKPKDFCCQKYRGPDR